jgi:hypothetical protein
MDYIEKCAQNIEPLLHNRLLNTKYLLDALNQVTMKNIRENVLDIQNISMTILDDLIQLNDNLPLNLRLEDLRDSIEFKDIEEQDLDEEE